MLLNREQKWWWVAREYDRWKVFTDEYGKDLFWYTRDKQSPSSEMDSIREEIKRIKEDEEQAMREVLGLTPKRASRPQGNRLDKHEYTELVKRGSTADDLGAQHAEAIMVQGLGLYKAPRNQPESITLQRTLAKAPGKNEQTTINESDEDQSMDTRRKRRRREERDERRPRSSNDEPRHEEGRDREGNHRKHHEKKRSNDSDDKRIHQSRHKGKSRHDSD
ncbi:multiple myeloma tumor-associated protein 2 homolog isoform X2 [Zingiber officinale]|uniref:Multiple myeloma tumor-associated protein 2-like N-terminal domain-containing protein n=1 Tax=Zingiber officinale TaxID=94328 RepID=A0A8J5LIJ1_ZINOF|nr:multiple myeloma tumor-associated protein 2 homolog isoform X2 [Zingiber officinale]KAG6516767.1 hypothetical protein ZIOFF_027241 [Zingiber officinale]